MELGRQSVVSVVGTEHHLRGATDEEQGRRDFRNLEAFFTKLQHRCCFLHWQNALLELIIVFTPIAIFPVVNLEVGERLRKHGHYYLLKNYY